MTSYPQQRETLVLLSTMHASFATQLHCRFSVMSSFRRHAVSFFNDVISLPCSAFGAACLTILHNSCNKSHGIPRPPGAQCLNYWAHAYKPKLPMSAQRCRHCRLTNLVIEYRVISWDNWLLNMFKDERLMGSYTVNGFSIESGLFLHPRFQIQLLGKKEVSLVWKLK